MRIRLIILGLFAIGAAFTPIFSDEEGEYLVKPTKAKEVTNKLKQK